MMSSSRYWRDQLDFRLIKEEDPNNPNWCPESRPFVEWGERLVEHISHDPTDGAIGWAKAALLDNYAERIRQTTSDHRPETNLGSHHCLHEALFVIWEKVRYVKLYRAVPELQPVHLGTTLLHPVIDGDVEPEPSVQEFSGIVIGHTEDEPEESDGDEQGV